MAAPPRSTVTVGVEGVEMPGRSCSPAAGTGYRNVHVGVQRGQEAVDLVPGDAAGAAWSFPVTVKHLGGELDFSGPFVHGRRGDRFIYLSWGEVDGEAFRMFRRAKLHLADVPAEVLAAAARGANLRCRVRMTDGDGCPRCARVRPPDAIWTLAP